MTAEVKERHRRAAAETGEWTPGAIAGYLSLSSWIATGDTSKFSNYDDSVAQLLSTAQALADAEERGRIEERVRCLAMLRASEMAAGYVSDNAIELVRALVGELTDRNLQIEGTWLDAARKELGE